MENGIMEGARPVRLPPLSVGITCLEMVCLGSCRLLGSAVALVRF